jgi:hypothetical protein
MDAPWCTSELPQSSKEHSPPPPFPFQGTVSRDGNFFEGLNILFCPFGVCADGFQGLSKAFHYNMQLLTFYLLL